MKLIDLLCGLEYEVLRNPDGLENEIADVAYDTRKLVANSVFVCIKGAKLDSHTLAPKAIELGAIALIVENDVDVQNATVIRVKDSRYALAIMSANYFGHPATQLKTIGITGTKGKTTTTYFMKELLESAGYKVGLVGTIGAMIGDQQLKTINTTPESYELQKLLRQMVDEGCQFLTMEVSSQGLMLHRTAGITFDVGVFLNISRDHIGPAEHESLEEYLFCKSLLFRQCKHGILNIDDEKCSQILEGHTCTYETFGFSDSADTKITSLEPVKKNSYMGILFKTDGQRKLSVKVGAPGKFTAYDSLAAICALDVLGVSFGSAVNALENVKIRGRVETVDVPTPYPIIIDFAHDGLGVQSLMEGVLQYSPKRIIAVFGLGGNRSKLRRADAGEALGKTAWLTIVTSNCPRYESPEQIIADIQEGLDRTSGKYEIIPDRRAAIKYAMTLAQPDDMLLLIGKGHWDYDEVNGVKYPFDERKIVNELYRELYGD